MWDLRLSLCSHILVYLSSFVDFKDLGFSVFISAEKRRDCGVLGTSLHPGNDSYTLLLIKHGCCAAIADFVSFYFGYKHCRNLKVYLLFNYIVHVLHKMPYDRRRKA